MLKGIGSLVIQYGRRKGGESRDDNTSGTTVGCWRVLVLLGKKGDQEETRPDHFDGRRTDVIFFKNRF